MPQAPDSPRRIERNHTAESVALGAGLALTLAILWLLVTGLQNLTQPMPIATPAAPRTIVVAPSPDTRIGAALAAVATNTAGLPTFTAAYAIAQTETAGDALATWAAGRQQGRNP